jgi:hypothetical protein
MHEDQFVEALINAVNDKLRCLKFAVGRELNVLDLSHLMKMLRSVIVSLNLDGNTIMVATPGLRVSSFNVVSLTFFESIPLRSCRQLVFFDALEIVAMTRSAPNCCHLSDFSRQICIQRQVELAVVITAHVESVVAGDWRDEPTLQVMS